MAEFDNREPREEIFSKAVRAGKRTYFFDVKSTRSNDYFLTITESKRRFGDEGEKPFYEKHKIFLYKEDFEKFSEGLTEVVNFIRNAQGDDTPPPPPPPEGNRFSDVDFDDLGETK
ncbi:MAG: DUF3276 family protein [Bacteroidia bacterium]